MNNADHKRLVLPGPVEVRREILDAQAQWMIGHRMPEFVELFARVQAGLQQAFLTGNMVLVVGASGTGLWEGAARSCVREGRKALHFVNGAFSQRWAEVSRANGKQVDVVDIPWGEAVTPDRVRAALEQGAYDAVCVVHNETSTGVTSPVQAIGEVVRQHDETLFLVDSVSGFLGIELRVDDWGIDVGIASSQKAFALPPGLAFAPVSERALARARQVEHRGYYFDFLELAGSHRKNNTPATPPISLLYAADRQLRDITAEGLEARWQRHLQMRDRTVAWAQGRGFGLFAQEGYRSPTVTAVANTRGVDVDALASFMAACGFAIDKGYGKLRGQTFRIAHMGDMQPDELDEVLSHIDAYLEGLDHAPRSDPRSG
jgi:predicted phosphoserine aminotransferase